MLFILLFFLFISAIVVVTYIIFCLGLHCLHYYSFILVSIFVTIIIRVVFFIGNMVVAVVAVVVVVLGCDVFVVVIVMLFPWLFLLLFPATLLLLSLVLCLLLWLVLPFGMLVLFSCFWYFLSAMVSVGSHCASA